MASKQRKTISLNVLVDKKNDRVIYAEADKEFVDVLFSFLTLPMGTIIRLLRKQSQPSLIGSMNNLYKSMEVLETRHFQNQACKTMLLRTRNSSADECRKLSLNIDDSDPLKYYICSGWTRDQKYQHRWLSTFSYSPCGCGSMLSTEVSFSASSNKIDTDGVFVKGSATFIVTDDLQVMPMSTATTLALLNNLGIKDTKALEKRTFDIGLEEVLSLLEISLVSKSPLTGLLLFKKKVLSTEFNFKALEKFEKPRKVESDTFTKINLKIIVRNLTQKFYMLKPEKTSSVSFFNILTFPLGAMVKLLNRTPSFGCLTKLYKSVEELNTERWMKSLEHKYMLLDPKVSLQYGGNRSLGIVTQVAPQVYLNYDQDPFYGATATTEGFVRGPATFMVTDDLVITPLSTISTISFLDNLKVPINEIEEREALRILEASMTSRSVLSSVLLYNSCAKQLSKRIVEFLPA